ncbi:Metalloenzyme, LuxS/M16 peptidase-like domain-containing protein [Rozella allomycis CSF55]|uniref:Cytochrome b-c1 complex subunit 2, mitochondrial n=1 Tax=Rozella allomycis (strain CSF55) TaxID=988480 RepID=A0A075AXA2_ROZAC|nr:Metalloenzyme, LuxS/M16 peptidase-like domain-containing protein [Rozella allomycis CSF55]|eukprot:EPZ34950.1 Metalloenzyme, LuxS/M16 peptidase-like domain-containing protein [Rozella allomycis CSF55]
MSRGSTLFRKQYSLLRRSFASATGESAAAKESSGPFEFVDKLPKPNVQFSNANRLHFATVDRHQMNSHLMLSIPIGTRNESSTSLGYTQAIKHVMFKNNLVYRQVAIHRAIEVASSKTAATFGREYLTVSADFPRQLTTDVLDYMSSMLSLPSFRDYDMHKVEEAIKFEFEQAETNGNIVVQDKLHRVAFRKGLGNPLFVNPKSISLDPNNMLEYYLNATKDANVVVTGVNVDHALVQDVAGKMFPNGGITTLKDLGSEEIKKFANPKELADLSSRLNGLSGGMELLKDASVYKGGEWRGENNSDELNYFGLGFEGVSLKDKDYPAFLVLSALLRTDVNIPFGRGESVIHEVDNEFANVNISDNHFSYSDAGLFTFTFKSLASKDRLKKVIEKTVQTAKSFELNDELLQRGKNNALMTYHYQIGNRESHSDYMANQVLFGGNYKTHDELKSALHEVTAEQVKQVLNKVFSSKPSVVALGDDFKLPYADELEL